MNSVVGRILGSMHCNFPKCLPVFPIKIKYFSLLDHCNPRHQSMLHARILQDEESRPVNSSASFEQDEESGLFLRNQLTADGITIGQFSHKGQCCRNRADGCHVWIVNFCSLSISSKSTRWTRISAFEDRLQGHNHGPRCHQPFWVQGQRPHLHHHMYSGGEPYWLSYTHIASPALGPGTSSSSRAHWQRATVRWSMRFPRRWTYSATRHNYQELMRGPGGSGDVGYPALFGVAHKRTGLALAQAAHPGKIHENRVQ